MARIKARLAGKGGSLAKNCNAETRHAAAEAGIYCRRVIAMLTIYQRSDLALSHRNRGFSLDL